MNSTQSHVYNFNNKLWLRIHFEGKRCIASHWHGFMKQCWELRGHKSLSVSTAAAHRRLSDCCLSSWLFTQHIDFQFMAHSSLYYQTSQTGINLLFTLAHANRELLLCLCVPRLPLMTRQCGWLLAVRPAHGGKAKLLWVDLGLLCVWGNLKIFKTVPTDYSSVPWHVDVRFRDFCYAAQI